MLVKSATADPAVPSGTECWKKALLLRGVILQKNIWNFEIEFDERYVLKNPV